MWTHKIPYADVLESSNEGATALIRLVANEQLRPHVDGFLADVVSGCAEFLPEKRISFADTIEQLTAPSLVSDATRVLAGPPGGPPPVLARAPGKRRVGSLPPSAHLDSSPPVTMMQGAGQRRVGSLPPSGPGTQAAALQITGAQGGTRDGTSRPAAASARGGTGRGPDKSIAELDRKASNLHGFHEDHGVPDAAKDGPGREFERESSRHRHQARRDTLALSKRLRSEGTVAMAMAFVGRLRISSRSFSGTVEEETSRHAAVEREPNLPTSKTLPSSDMQKAIERRDAEGGSEEGEHDYNAPENQPPTAVLARPSVVIACSTQPPAGNTAAVLSQLDKAHDVEAAGVGVGMGPPGELLEA